ncbi:MAG: hypothetical protein DBP01_02350 [gamma proteobacterium symbiont of Ctena orbiculata]|nr:MAG: hypothetical protein DBP01_02350 [gamma proteobacterium symbiont of Ctena orbiculata]
MATMKLERISVKLLVTFILLLLGALVILLSLIAAVQFREAAISSQSESLSRTIGVAVRESVKQLVETGTDLGREVQKEKELRAAVKALRASPNNPSAKVKVVKQLDDHFYRRYVTAGIVDLKKLRLYDLDFNQIAQSSEGLEGLAPGMPEFLLDRARGRQRSERLKVLDGMWASRQGPVVHSVMVPVGGLRLLAYLEVVVSPAHQLHAVGKMTKLPLQIQDLAGNTLYQDEAWKPSKTTFTVSYTHPGAEGQGLLTLRSLENGEKLFAQMNRTQITAVVSFLILIAMSIALALWLLNKYLFNPVKNLGVAMNRCAEGDMTLSISEHGLKELVALGAGMNRLVSSLQTRVKDIGNATEQVAISAEELRSVTNENRKDIERQQKGSEQVATAMTEMLASAEEVARNATHVSENAAQAEAGSQKGRDLVNETVSAIRNMASNVEQTADSIQALNEHSNQIGMVIDVIREIADQTNLLALNAAIEAARAGEAGRGFAVVSDEVRSLANRTQESTHKIEKIIDHLQKGMSSAMQTMESNKEEAQNSVACATRADEQLGVIADAISSVAAMNIQIASAGREQKQVVEEINQNVIAISQTAENSSQGAAQTTSASQNLASLASELKCLMTWFRV